MKKRKIIKKERMSSKFTFALALLVFNMMLASSIIMGIVMFIFNRFGLLTITGKIGPLGSVLFMLLISFIFATIISSFFGYRTIRPLLAINSGIKEVANGNFEVRVEEIDSKSEDTEINMLIKNFNMMVESLSKTETLRSDFIANVSHEFKSPLSTIQGYVSLLSDESLTKEEKDKYIKIIYDSTSKLTTLTSNILKITKIENSDITINPVSFNLSEQIRDAIIQLESMWDKKGINFDLNFNDDIVIESDPEFIKHIWINVISNAIKFSPDNSEIKIVILEASSYVQVSFTDYGVGMDNDTVKHIFEKFYQGDKSHSKEGNGLGLSLVRKIVNLCNGKIYVESSLGEGSTFTVVLPKVYNHKL